MTDVDWRARAERAEARIAAVNRVLDDLSARVVLFTEIDGPVIHEACRKRGALGPYPSVTETFAQLREIIGDAFDGVDPVAYVRELRGHEDDEAALSDAAPPVAAGPECGFSWRKDGDLCWCQRQRGHDGDHANRRGDTTRGSTP